MIQPCFVPVVSSSFLTIQDQHCLCRIVYAHSFDRCKMLCSYFNFPELLLGSYTVALSMNVKQFVLLICETIIFLPVFQLLLRLLLLNFPVFFVKQCSNFPPDSSNCHGVYVAIISSMSKQHYWTCMLSIVDVLATVLVLRLIRSDKTSLAVNNNPPSLPNCSILETVFAATMMVA